MLKIAICDDEWYYLKLIHDLITKLLYERGISEYDIELFSSGEELCKRDNEIGVYQVIFLDINMPGINGLQTAEIIREKNQKVFLVFITAFIDYAVEGYKMEPIRFLLKDMFEEMLPECIDTIIKKLHLQAQRIKYNFLEGEKDIFIDKIYYVESWKHKLNFYVCEKELNQYSLYNKLDNIEKELNHYGFIRIHKSFLVNAKYIDHIINYKVKMQNGKILSVPREKFQEVKEIYYEIKAELI